MRTFWAAARQVTPDIEGEKLMAGTFEGDIADRFERAGMTDVTGGSLLARADYAGFDDFWEPFTFGVKAGRRAPALAARGAAGGGARGVPRGSAGGGVLARSARLVRPGNRARLGSPRWARPRLGWSNLQNLHIHDTRTVATQPAKRPRGFDRKTTKGTSDHLPVTAVLDY